MALAATRRDGADAAVRRLKGEDFRDEMELAAEVVDIDGLLRKLPVARASTRKGERSPLPVSVVGSGRVMPI